MTRRRYAIKRYSEGRDDHGGVGYQLVSQGVHYRALLCVNNAVSRHIKIIPGLPCIRHRMVVYAYAGVSGVAYNIPMMKNGDIWRIGAAARRRGRLFTCRKQQQTTNNY